MKKEKKEAKKDPKKKKKSKLKKWIGDEGKRVTGFIPDVLANI